ncbi:MAG: nitronate monooxygenase [bacterium]|nr:nitronate monooxygenase [bacterium]
MKCLPKLKIGPVETTLPIIQGGMGVGVSLSGLASSVAEEGGIGVIATAGIGLLEAHSAKDMPSANRRALRREIDRARQKTDGALGVNIMLAMSDFDELAATAVEEEVDVVFMGAGLPLKVPATLDLDRLRACRTQFVPKVSSARAGDLILQYWSRHHGLVPAAFVLEGPMAGGHQGFKKNQLTDPRFALENLLPELLAAVAPYEDRYGRRIPVIAAGGVYTGADILACLDLGAAGVKMGTRFVATHECDAHPKFKQAYLDCGDEDIVIIDSPVGLPGRAIRNGFLADVAEGMKKPYNCAWRCLKSCNVRKAPYCIAQALGLAKLGNFKNGFAFAGANAFRVKELVSVKALMATLVQEFEEAVRMKRAAV